MGGRRAALAAGLVLAVTAAAGPAAACRLAMAIGMDVSASVDEREHALQREGMAAALLDPEVSAAFLAGDVIVLRIYEWSGRARQTVIVDWTPIADEGDLAAVAGMLRTVPRVDREFPTALGQALIFASAEFEAVGECPERVVNISGDGENNDGMHPRVAIREFGFEGITVNGLVIGGNVERLRRYFEEHVIHGPDAFVEATLDFEGFADAMRRKLIRELGPVVMDTSAGVPRAH
jgi:hypothetical protein